MKIISLLPSVTEILCELGLEDNIYGVTHECDFPESIKKKRKIEFTKFDFEKLNNLQINKIIEDNMKKGKFSYFLDTEALKNIEPDYVVTQDLCEVCAVSENTAIESLDFLKKKPKIITISPKNIKEIENSITKLANEFQVEEKGIELANRFSSEINKIASKTKDVIDRPRIFCMEWINPIYSAGYWVPEMVEIAGGISGVTKASERSKEVKFNEIIEYAPNYIFIMSCGYTIDDSLREMETLLKNRELNKIPAFKKGEVYLVDANAYFTRPTTRIIEGIRLLTRTINSEVLDFEPMPDSILNLQNYIHFESFAG